MEGGQEAWLPAQGQGEAGEQPQGELVAGRGQGGQGGPGGQGGQGGPRAYGGQGGEVGSGGQGGQGGPWGNSLELPCWNRVGI